MPPDVARADLAERFPDAPGADTAGFFASLSTLALTPEWELTLRARLEDRTRVPIASVTGTRSPLRSSFVPQLAPLMVTTLGRTGSTAFVRMLGAHPEIAAYRPFEYEPRVATYWMGVLRGLAEPASYRRQITPTGTIDGTWWLGAEPPHPRRIKDPTVHDWLAGEAVEELAEFCQSRVDELYRRAARAQGRGGGAFFAEKYRPDSVPALMWEVYPAAREVILARDFRDMVSSMFAFNAKRGFQGFRRGSAGSDAEFIAENLGGSATALARAWESRSGRAHLVRYEDLIQRPAETVESLLGYLGLEASSERGRGDAPDAHRSRAAERGPPHRGRPRCVDRPLAHRPGPRAAAGLRAGVRACAARLRLRAGGAGDRRVTSPW